MIKLDTIPFIIVDLKPGIYRIGQDSCEGKTYMHYLIASCPPSQVPFSTYSYIDYTESTPIQSKIKEHTTVLFLDRYDLYAREQDASLLENFKNNGGIVLLDCKLVDNLWVDCGYCDLIRRKEGFLLV